MPAERFSSLQCRVFFRAERLFDAAETTEQKIEILKLLKNVADNPRLARQPRTQKSKEKPRTGPHVDLMALLGGGKKTDD